MSFFMDNILPAQRRNDLLDWPLPFLAVTNCIGQHGLGQIVEISCRNLDRKKDDNDQDFKYKVDNRTCKGFLQFVAIS